MTRPAVLLLGSGGREHALAVKLQQSCRVYVSPGNGGTRENVKLDGADGVIDFCRDHKIELVVVGHEAPLADGIVDTLTAAGIRCFGPSKKAAQIEASKAFAKQLMTECEIPTAPYAVVSSLEDACAYIDQVPHSVVVKASGLAAGKGVILPDDNEDAKEWAEDLLRFHSELVIEQRLEGDEFSLLAFVNGTTLLSMPVAKDYKQLDGKNTGGMGAVCPYPIEPKWLDACMDIMATVVTELDRRGTPFVGVLYGGFMLTKNGPYVLEFNCRFGDPEAQVILPLMVSDLYPVLSACLDGNLDSCRVIWSGQHAAGIVLASQGYPVAPVTGKMVTIDFTGAVPENIQLYHAGINDHLVTTGGRVLTVTALGTTLQDTVNTAYSAVNCIHFEGMQYRTDIGAIDTPASFIASMAPLIASTHTQGCLSEIGGFSGLFQVGSRCTLAAGTDGVGTKLLLARAVNDYSTVGVDLVAMCVNDILMDGAVPLFFLDYMGTGRFQPDIARGVMSSIIQGCKEAGCALIGGETAVMSGVYKEEDMLDLVGFAVGVTDSVSKCCPMMAGDYLLGLPSSGLHSNGFTLVRELMERHGLHHRHRAPFDPSRTLGQVLLTPTRIYRKQMLNACTKQHVKGAAHITGGGIYGNLKRILPDDLAAHVVLPPLPEVFQWLQQLQQLSVEQMVTTFNCGWGVILVVSAQAKDAVQDELKAVELGRLRSRHGLEPAVQITPRRTRVAVLLSGVGTNLQALLDATTQDPWFGATVCLVVSNVSGVQGLTRAEAAGIPTHVTDSEWGLHSVLMDHEIELICLAGYMKILSADFVNMWEHKILNIHPSLLPAFPGLHTHQRVLDAGCTITGSTVHWVTPELDAGPIVLQATVPVLPCDTVESLEARVKAEEHVLYPRALRRVLREPTKLSEYNKV